MRRSKVLRSVRTPGGQSLVLGQYRGYRASRACRRIPACATFAALKLHLDSWRWAGVPFFVRAGKRLEETATEVLVALKRPPQAVFGERPPHNPNYVRFRLGPDRVSIAIGAHAKKAGQRMLGRDLELFVCSAGEEQVGAYERLIGDALRGDPTLFTREDAVLEAWRILDPLLDVDVPVHEYAPGSQGPQAADHLGHSIDLPGRQPEPDRAAMEAKIDRGREAAPTAGGDRPSRRRRPIPRPPLRRFALLLASGAFAGSGSRRTSGSRADRDAPPRPPRHPP